MSVGASRTGNVTLVRVRINGKRIELRIETHYLLGPTRVERIMESFLLSFLPTKEDVFDQLSVPGNPVLHYVGIAIGRPVLDEARKRGIVVIDALLKELDAGGVGSKQTAYRQGMCMEDFRQAIRNANDRGCSYDDMEAILKEEAVRSVMDS